MSETKPYAGIRTRSAGGWYWVSKVVIRGYAAHIGYLPMCVYHLLASMVDKNQSCYPSQNYIARNLGCSRSSISRAIKTLIKHGLVKVTEGANRHRVYQLLEVSDCIPASGVSHRCNPDVAPEDPNKNIRTRTNNNAVVSISGKRLSREEQTARESLLASDMAEALDDRKNIKKYLCYARTYPEIILRGFLSQVRQMPNDKIRKSRAALFSFLLRQYDQQTS